MRTEKDRSETNGLGEKSKFSQGNLLQSTKLLPRRKTLSINWETPCLTSHGYRFTMIELLVVISIIMILASMLLPALKSVQQKAGEIECKNNMKQIGCACQMYAADFNGFQVIWGEEDKTNDYYNWINTLLDQGYIKVSLKPYVYMEISSSHHVFLCRNDKRIRPYGRDVMLRVNDTVHSIIFSYGYTRFLGSSGAARVKDSQIKNASMLIRLTDKEPSMFLVDTPDPLSVTGISYRHNSKSNILFCDGHVDNKKKNDFPLGNSNSYWQYDY